MLDDLSTFHRWLPFGLPTPDFHGDGGLGMLDDFKNRLIDAGWSVEPGNSLAPNPPTDGVKVAWMARKNGCTVIVSDRNVSVARGSARSSTPIDVVMRGYLLLPGALSEKYLPIPVKRGDLIPHEGKMTEEELELRRLLG